MALATGDLVVALLGALTLALGQAIARLPAPHPGDPLEASIPRLAHYKARLAGTGFTLTGLATITVAIAAGYNPATMTYIMGMAATIAVTLLLPPRKAEELLLSQPPEPGEGPHTPIQGPSPRARLAALGVYAAQLAASLALTLPEAGLAPQLVVPTLLLVETLAASVTILALTHPIALAGRDPRKAERNMMLAILLANAPALAVALLIAL